MNIRLTLFAALVLLPVSVSAQDSTVRVNATPFRKGQWAAQFQAGSTFGSLGFIKFRSPTRALMLDLRILGSHGENSSRDSSGVIQYRSLGSNATAQLRFGWRRYGGDGNGARIVSHYSWGVITGFHHTVSKATTGGNTALNGWTLGAFGDVGGTYLLTSKFGIGALATAALTYDIDRGKSSNGVQNRSWDITGSAISASLVATVFF